MADRRRDGGSCLVDGLKGFPEAISATFPQAQIQTCIVHLMRHSLKFYSWKDRKLGAGELKKNHRYHRVAGKETTHASTSARIAGEQAARTDAKSVHLNQTISTVTGKEVKSSLRPDVSTVRTDGKVDVSEVLSPGQNAGASAAKYEKALGDKAGIINCVPVDKC